MSSAVPRQRLRIFLVAGVAVPAGMTFLGLAIAYVVRREVIQLLPVRLSSLGLGVLTGLATILLVTVVHKSSKAVERTLRKTGTQVGMDALNQAGYPLMLFLVSTGAFGEEILFRGGLQPSIGVIPTALLFGFSHGGWRREMWAYVLLASAAGTVFGFMYQLTGDIWIPATAHVLHNVISTLLLGKDIDVSWKGLFPRVRLVPEQQLTEEKD